MPSKNCLYRYFNHEMDYDEAKIMKNVLISLICFIILSIILIVNLLVEPSVYKNNFIGVDTTANTFIFILNLFIIGVYNFAVAIKKIINIYL